MDFVRLFSKWQTYSRNEKLTYAVSFAQSRRYQIKNRQVIFHYASMVDLQKSFSSFCEYAHSCFLLESLFVARLVAYPELNNYPGVKKGFPSPSAHCLDFGRCSVHCFDFGKDSVLSSLRAQTSQGFPFSQRMRIDSNRST